MNKKYLYAALCFGLCIYLFTLISQLPASLFKPAFNDSLPIRVDKLSGTIWNGAIPNIELKVDAGFINIGQLNWQLKPLCFITLKICTDLQLSPNSNSQGDIYIDTAAQLSLSEALRLKDTQADIDAGWLMEMSALPISATGRIKLLAEQIAFEKNGSLATIFGELRWQKAAIDYPEEYDLGNYIITIDTLDEAENKTIQGILRDENGLINSNGTIDITEDGRVDININLQANQQTPDSLASTLSLIGKADSQGVYNIRHKTFLKTIL